MEDVTTSLSSKEIEKHDGHEVSNGEWLIARIERRRNSRTRIKERGKERTKRMQKKKKNKRKCFFCRKQMHYIRESAKKKKNESQ